MALSVTFIACRKEETPTVSSTGSTEANFTPRIKTFIQQATIKNRHKDANSLSLDSAEWYIEAGLNFELGTPWIDCTDRTLDSLEVTIPVSESGVAENTAFSAYNALHTGIVSKLVTGENHLIMADVNLVYTNGTEAVAKVLIVIGSGYSKTNQLMTGYGANEFIYFTNAGLTNNNCGCGTNQGGATTCSNMRIAQRVNATMDGLSYGCYYTDVESRGVDWLGNAPNLTMNTSGTGFPTGIPVTPYKIYRCQGANCGCMSPSMMSFYTQGSFDIMNQLKPTNKVPVSCAMDGTNTLNGANSQYWQMALYTYARLNCTRG
ncbi:MAG: hypothetical protein JNM62_03350 [Flavobacteriales bacterium]|nr:hypothetical protein [Flavobacteriales bacterium]